MVRENFGAQLRWFARKLIEIRVSEVNGYASPINFDPAILTSAPASVGFEGTPQDNINRMLGEISGVLIERQNLPSDRLTWTELNGHIQINGYSTELLTLYLKDMFGESFVFFGEGLDDDHHVVVTYCERKTDVILSGNSLAVFRCLKEKFGMDVSFDELSEAIRNQDNFMTGSSSRRPELRSATETEKVAVTSAIYTLKERLREATGQTHFPEIIENVRGVGYKIVL